MANQLREPNELQRPLALSGSGIGIWLVEMKISESPSSHLEQKFTPISEAVQRNCDLNWSSLILANLFILP